MGWLLSRPALAFHCLCPLINSSNSFLWTTEAKVHLISLFFFFPHRTLSALISVDHCLPPPPFVSSFFSLWFPLWAGGVSLPGLLGPYSEPFHYWPLHTWLLLAFLLDPGPHLGMCARAYAIFASAISPHASNNCFKAGEKAWIIL